MWKQLLILPSELIHTIRKRCITTFLHVVITCCGGYYSCKDSMACLYAVPPGLSEDFRLV